MARSKIILISAGVLNVLLIGAGVYYILSLKRVDGTAAAASSSPIPTSPPGTAPAAPASAALAPRDAPTAPRAAAAGGENSAGTAPSAAPVSESTRSGAPAARAPRADGAGPAARRTKPSSSADPTVYVPPVLPAALQQDFIRKGFTLDVQSGNYLGGRTYAKTPHEQLVPIFINGSYAKDLRGHYVYLRQTIHDKLIAADVAMFNAKGLHLQVNYGFRSNELQAELFQQISGHGKVAQPGLSFHETGMAIDLQNWRDAQRYMIEAGFVGGCYGIEEDLVHYSIDEVTKSSDFEAFKRCTLKDIPKDILKGVGKVGGAITGILHKKND